MLHDSHLPLKKWFLAVYLMCESKKGISALQLKRTLGVAYRTAWYLCHRIRAAMEEAYPMPLKGIVEIDETFVGGKVKGKGRGYKGNKAIVVGAVQRQGKVVLQVVQARDRETLHGFIEQYTKRTGLIHRRMGATTAVEMATPAKQSTTPSKNGYAVTCTPTRSKTSGAS